MKRLFLIILALAFTLSPLSLNRSLAQQHARKARTTQTARRKAASVRQKGKADAPQKKADTSQKKATSKAKSADKTVYSNASIRGLQSQRSSIQKKIREQEKALNANKADVAKRLQDLLVINSEINKSQKNIESIEEDINHLDGNIGIMQSQLKTLEAQLADRKKKYIKSMQYMARHHTVQDRLMFIFSAKSFTQMYRRLRFVREYADYQKAQGKMVQAKQAQVNNKHKELKRARGNKSNLLYKGQQAKATLQNKQTEQQEIVKGLENQQKTIQGIIDDQKQKDAALNAQIDRLIAQEVAKARARAAAEAKKRAAAEAAAKKRAEELARKKAAAEAAARENARRIAEAKEREARLKAEAEAAAKAQAEAARQAEQEATQRREEAQRAATKAAQEAARKKAEAAARAAQEANERKARAEQAAREAAAARQAAEMKAAAEAERSKKELAEAREEAREASQLSTVDRMMSNGFEANQGRLPMPISGSYKIVSHFGQHNVEGLKGVTLDNKGINILGRPGCVARSIYDGEVSAVFGYAGTWVVMVRHGAFISVYCNLRSVSVRKGQRVSTRQTLGAVGTDNVLQFQLRKETAKLNPEAWLGR